MNPPLAVQYTLLLKHHSLLLFLTDSKTSYSSSALLCMLTLSVTFHTSSVIVVGKNCIKIYHVFFSRLPCLYFHALPTFYDDDDDDDADGDNDDGGSGGSSGVDDDDNDHDEKEEEEKQ